MADYKIGEEFKPSSEDEEAAKEKMMKIQKQLEEIIVANHENFSFIIAIHDDASKYSIYTGNGCPVCMVTRCLHWMIDNKLQHDNEESAPNIIAINVDELFGKPRKIKKSEIN